MPFVKSTQISGHYRMEKPKSTNTVSFEHWLEENVTRPGYSLPATGRVTPAQMCIDHIPLHETDNGTSQHNLAGSSGNKLSTYLDALRPTVKDLYKTSDTATAHLCTHRCIGAMIVLEAGYYQTEGIPGNYHAIVQGAIGVWDTNHVVAIKVGDKKVKVPRLDMRDANGSFLVNFAFQQANNVTLPWMPRGSDYSLRSLVDCLLEQRLILFTASDSFEYSANKKEMSAEQRQAARKAGEGFVSAKNVSTLWVPDEALTSVMLQAADAMFLPDTLPSTAGSYATDERVPTVVDLATLSADLPIAGTGSKTVGTMDNSARDSYNRNRREWARARKAGI